MFMLGEATRVLLSPPGMQCNLLVLRLLFQLQGAGPCCRCPPSWKACCCVRGNCALLCYAVLCNAMCCCAAVLCAVIGYAMCTSLQLLTSTR